MNPYLAEVVGTALLILLGNGVVTNVVLNKTKGQNSGWIVITFGWAMAVLVGAYAAAPYSGAHLNPAVTLALASIGLFAWSKVAGYIAAQILGGVIGSVFVYLAYLPHWAETPDPGAKLACFSTSPAIRKPVANFITEVIATFALILAILAVPSAKNLVVGSGPGALSAGFFGIYLVALIVLSVGLSLGGPTGYAINPARDLGPRIAHAILPIPGKGSSDWSYALIPIVGPCVGGIAAALFYQALFC